MISIFLNLDKAYDTTRKHGILLDVYKTMCAHFCQLRKQHLDPQLYRNGTQIPSIGEAKFIGLIFDSKL